MSMTPTTEEAKTKGQEPKGAWMQTFCLPHFPVLDPDPSQILIEDIAHHLSQNVRYGGAGIRFLSVAEHSVHMARAAGPEDALWALLHDASEAYLHDVVRPVKRALSGYSAAEDRIMGAICERFGLSPKMPAAVKRLDNRILIDETRQNMRPSDVVWSFGGETEPLGITLQFWTPEQAEREFLATFSAITGQTVTLHASAAPRADSALGTLAVPDGWMLVPEEATGAMWSAGRAADEDSGHSYSAVWRAMGEAATAPPVLCSPAPSSPGVPDSVRALSEAATQGEWYTESEKCDGSYGSGEDCSEGYLAYSILTDAERPHGNPGVIAETSNSTLGVIHEESDEDGHTAWDETARANTAFIVAAVNFVRTLISTHPAGQSTGQGADGALTCTEAERDESYEIGKRDGYDEGVQDAAIRAGLDGEYRASSDPERHVPDASTMLERIAERVDGLEVSLARTTKPAPDSTRTGQVEETIAVPASALRWLFGEGPDEDGVWFGDQIRGKGAFWWRSEFKRRVEVARPAAPEAQGAWRSLAADDVLAERRRQVEAEGWTPAHDDSHSRGEIALAAASYAKHAAAPPTIRDQFGLGSMPSLWPWDSLWWRLSDRRRDLVKAAALILAEIERLDRLPAPPASSGQESAR